VFSHFLIFIDVWPANTIYNLLFVSQVGLLPQRVKGRDLLVNKMTMVILNLSK
jgi:hypothetical protein